MKKIIFLSLYLCFFLKQFTTTVHAQNNDITLKIKSENKEIFKESGMLKELADDFYFAQMDKLKKDITEWLRGEIKRLFGETMYSDKIELSDKTSASIIVENKKIYYSYIIQSNIVKCRITQPDHFIEPGWAEDPWMNIKYDIYGNFELQQYGKAESIRVMNPTWKVDITFYDERCYYALEYKKEFPKCITFYRILNEIKTKLNNYVHTSIINNPELLKEFQLDGDKKLVAIADPNSRTLTFQHYYSPTGIVKRNVTKDPGNIGEGPKSTTPTTVPVSTSPAGGIGGKNNSTKPPPIIKKSGNKN